MSAINEFYDTLDDINLEITKLERLGEAFDVAGNVKATGVITEIAGALQRRSCDMRRLLDEATRVKVEHQKKTATSSPPSEFDEALKSAAQNDAPAGVDIFANVQASMEASWEGKTRWQGEDGQSGLRDDD